MPLRLVQPRAHSAQEDTNAQLPRTSQQCALQELMPSDLALAAQVAQQAHTAQARPLHQLLALQEATPQR